MAASARHSNATGDSGSISSWRCAALCQQLVVALRDGQGRQIRQQVLCLRISREKLLIELRRLFVAVQQLQRRRFAAQGGIAKRLAFQAAFESFQSGCRLLPVEQGDSQPQVRARPPRIELDRFSKGCRGLFPLAQFLAANRQVEQAGGILAFRQRRIFISGRRGRELTQLKLEMADGLGQLGRVMAGALRRAEVPRGLRRFVR